MREEQDFLGKLSISDTAFYGIHAKRASLNFPPSLTGIDPYFIKAYLLVKKACIRSARENHLLKEEKAIWIEKAVDRLLETPELLESSVIVPISQGGAGTSLNMNLNEIIANQALFLMGKNLGDYSIIHPNDDVNIAQSTNDTYPTALKIALIWRLRELTETVCTLQESLQAKEKAFSSIIKTGRTQMQDALPVTLGIEFGSWAQAIARDRWRLYKAEERLRVVNLGGTAIGTGLNAPRRYVFKALEHLRAFSGVGVAKAESLNEATANQDLFLEAFAWVKILSVNLYKIAQDLRFLSSSPVAEINLPAVQAGSSMMPKKVNPVILEMLIQVCRDVFASDQVISSCIAEANLELNPWLPQVSKHFCSSLFTLNHAVQIFMEKCLNNITANKEQCYKHLLASSTFLTVLNPVLGYEKVASVIEKSVQKKVSVIDILKQDQLLTDFEIQKLLKQESLLNQH